MLSAQVVQAVTAMVALLLLGVLCGGAVLWIRRIAQWRRAGLPQPAGVWQLQARHWSGLDLVIVGALVSLGLAATMAISLWLKRQGPSSQWVYAFAAFQNSVLQMLVAVVILLRMRIAGRSMRDSFGAEPAASPRAGAFVAQVCKWYVYLLPLVFVAGLLSHGLFASADEEVMFQPVLRMFTDTATPGWFRWWILFSAVIFAPLVEEAFFRGMLLPVLLRRHAVWPALFAGSLLFAAVHGHAPAMLPLFVLGGGLGAAYLYTGNLLVPIGIHAMFNAVSLLLVLIKSL
jgi:membrane protease YdiL (CAAX protease family)